MRTSVVIPSHKRHERLQEAVELFLETATSDIEIIVVVDRDALPKNLFSKPVIIV